MRRFGFALVFVMTALIVSCAKTALEQEIAGHIEVTSNGATLQFPEPLRAAHPVTSLFLETTMKLTDLTDNRTPLTLARDAGLEVTLLQDDGAKMPLELSWVDQYVEASAPALQRPSTEPPASLALRLKAAKPISFERVVWLSWDPAAEKDGTKRPTAAKRQ